MKKFLVLAVFLVIFVIGCSNLDLSKFPADKPLVTGYDGWWSQSLHREGERLRGKLKVPVQVAAVHYRDRTVSGLRVARKQNRPVVIITYSAGWHEALLAVEQCPEVEIDHIVGVDPSYIADHDFYLPKNIKKASFYFSTASGDFLAWARGDEQKIRVARDPRVESIKYLNCKHLECIEQPALQSDLEKLVELYSSPEVSLAKR